MPELPEVEFGRRVAHEIAVGHVITKVRCADDDIVFADQSPRAVQRALVGARVVDTHRHGKHLYWQLDRRPWPIFHFGMSGAFRTPGDRPLKIENSPRVVDRTWPPRFWKILCEFDDGAKLAMINPRRLGRIRMRDDPASAAPLSALGFDPLLNMPRLPAFRAHLAKRRGVVKGLLLDQKFAAGIGNWIADEVLYRAKIAPRRRVEELSAAEVKALHGAIKAVIGKAVAVNARKDDFPRTWLFHQRWGRREDATIAGHRIEHDEVAGRSTAWVPSVQR